MLLQFTGKVLLTLCTVLPFIVYTLLHIVYYYCY